MVIIAPPDEIADTAPDIDPILITPDCCAPCATGVANLKGVPYSPDKSCGAVMG